MIEDTAARFASIQPKLRKLLPLLGSDSSGEVLATVNALARTLGAAGFDWHDLTQALSGSLEEEETPTEPVPEKPWQVAARLLLDKWRNRLSAWEIGFCESTSAQTYKQTEKQEAILQRIITKVSGKPEEPMSSPTHPSKSPKWSTV